MRLKLIAWPSVIGVIHRAVVGGEVSAMSVRYAGDKQASATEVKLLHVLIVAAAAPMCQVLSWAGLRCLTTKSPQSKPSGPNLGATHENLAPLLPSAQHTPTE